jgi:TIGR03009 family protein
MRFFGLVLAALLAAGTPIAAQQELAPAAPAQQQTLDNYLLRWEQEMQKIQTLSAEVGRIDKDKTFNTATKLVGYAAYRKAGAGPNTLNLAMLELRTEGKQQEVREKFICTGTFIYRMLPEQKQIEVYELPKPKPGQVADDNFLSFMFGMKATEARRRYELRLAREDQYYIYVDILPRFPNDRADFTRARLVLNKSNFLPRQLWFEHVNGSETTWDVPRSQSGAELDRRLFDPPQTPQGWRVVNMPKPGETPKPVIRNGSP